MVVQRHLDAFVRVLVVHVVDDVHRIGVDAGEPLHHFFELADHIVEVEVLAAHRRAGRPCLLTRDLVPSSVDGVEEALGEVGAGAEELHLRAGLRWRDTTRKRAVVSPGQTHDLVVFKVEDARFESDLGGEPPEGDRKAR